MWTLWAALLLGWTGPDPALPGDPGRLHLTGRWTRISPAGCPALLREAEGVMKRETFGLRARPGVQRTALTASLRSVAGERAGVFALSVACWPVPGGSAVLIDAEERLGSAYEAGASQGLQRLAQALGALRAAPPPAPEGDRTGGTRPAAPAIMGR